MSKKSNKASRKSAATQPAKKIIPRIPNDAISGKWKFIIAGALAILAMAIYSPSYNYDFVYDDDAVIRDNRFVKAGIDGLSDIWTTSYFQGYDENMNARAFRPIPLTTLALEVEFFGLNPKIHHTANILFYGLTAFFLFLLMNKLLRKHHPFLVLSTCLLFILHPIHLEVIANIKSRDTLLGFLGLCVSVWLLLKYIDSKKISLLLASILFYSIGLFSKEEVITSLATIPLMLFFFRDLKFKNIALYALPFLGAVVIFLIYRSNILGGLNEGVKLTYLDNSLLAADGIIQRVSSNILVLGHYLLKTVFPHPLISDYSFSTIPLVNWDDWRVYISIIANLALLAIGLKGLFARKAYGFGPLYYFISLSIFSSIVVTNVSAYNDRFLYVAVLGICFSIALVLTHFIKKVDPMSIGSFFKSNFSVAGLFILICTLSIVKIESHLPTWKNRYVLFEHDLKLAPHNARLRKNHGGSFAKLAVENQTSNPELAKQYAAQAIEQLEYALSQYNRMGTGHIHLGNMYIILGQYDNAVRALTNALDIAPDNYFAKASLGNVLYRTGDYQKSIETLQSIPVHLMNPGDYDVLARSYDRLGNSAKAAEMRAKMK